MSRPRLILYAILVAALVFALYGIVNDGRDATPSSGSGSVAGAGGAPRAPRRPSGGARKSALARPGAVSSATPNATTPNSDATGLVSGAVRRYRDRRPVAGATLVFREEGGAERRVATSSGPSGRYEARLPAGRFRLAVTASGFAHGRDDLRVKVMPDAVATQLHIDLYELIPLRGKVVDLRGATVAGARIEVVSAKHASGVALASAARGQSDERGAFLFAVPPGSAILRVVTQRDERRVGPLHLGDRSTLPAGVSGLRVVLGGGLTLTGRVLGPDRQQLRGKGARVLIKDELGSRSLAVAEDGRFTAGGFSPGPKLLQAMAPGYSPSRVISLTLALGSGNNAILPLARRRRLKGRVVAVDKHGRRVGVGGVRVEAWPSTPRGKAIWLAPAARATSSVDGSYALDGVADLPLLISASSPDGRRGRRLGVVSDGREVLLPLLSTGGIAGVVSGGKAGKGLNTLRLRLERSGTARRWLVATRGGRYSLDGLSQGVVRLIVDAPQMAPKVRPALSIIGGTKVQANLVLDRGAQLAGEVRDGRGVALPGVRVALDDAARSFTFSDAAGRYRLHRVPRGYRMLTLTRAGYPEHRAKGLSLFAGRRALVPAVTMRAKSATSTPKLVGCGVVLELRGGVAEVVRVVAKSGAALAGVRVGDQLLAVDGKANAGQSLAAVEARLRGLPGTAVTLGLGRLEKGKRQTMNVGVLRGL